MVRRIIWTSKADSIFSNILEFYIERNKSKLYYQFKPNELIILLVWDCRQSLDFFK